MIDLDSGVLPDSVIAKVGENITLKGIENPTTGYTWILKEDALIKVVSDTRE